MNIWQITNIYKHRTIFITDSTGQIETFIYRQVLINEKIIFKGHFWKHFNKYSFKMLFLPCPPPARLGLQSLWKSLLQIYKRKMGMVLVLVIKME